MLCVCELLTWLKKTWLIECMIHTFLEDMFPDFYLIILCGVYMHKGGHWAIVICNLA